MRIVGNVVYYIVNINIISDIQEFAFRERRIKAHDINSALTHHLTRCINIK